MQPPDFPEGEDETSMLRHASILREEQGDSNCQLIDGEDISV